MQYALRLPNTGGYPMTAHKLIDSTPGSRLVILANVLPGQLVPIEERGISLEYARKLHDQPGCPLELVQIDKNGKEIHHKAGATATDETEEGKD